MESTLIFKIPVNLRKAVEVNSQQLNRCWI